MLPGYFGGEEGITASRTKGLALIGLDLGSQLAVYYLIALWALLAAALMHAFARTPVGRMCNAVRDNPERAEFVGYNTHGVRFFAFAVAALVRGPGGRTARASTTRSSPRTRSARSAQGPCC